MRICFRVDGDQKLGAGHVMRCISLAVAFQEKGHVCVFATRSLADDLLKIVRQHNIEVNWISDRKNESKTFGVSTKIANEVCLDAKETLKHLRHHSFDWLVLDHYDAGDVWQSMVFPHVKFVLVIDDEGKCSPGSNLILRQQTESRLVGSCTNVNKHSILQGLDFFLLRPELRTIKGMRNSKKISRKSLSINISFGLTEQNAIVGHLLNAIEILAVRYHVSCNLFCQNVQEMREKFLKDRGEYGFELTIRNDFDNYINCLICSDIAIGGAGVSAMERVFLGVPSLAITLAENQSFNSSFLSANNLAVTINPQEDVESAVISGVLDLILNHQNIETNLRHQSFIDGFGAFRVRDKILSYSKIELHTEIGSRPVDLSDREVLLRWRNHNKIRGVMRNQKVISVGEHKIWFDKLIRSASSTALIFLFKKEPAGFVQFSWNNRLNNFEWGFYKDPSRNESLGTSLGWVGLNSFFANSKHKRLFAEINVNNWASVKLHKKLGFSITSEQVKARGASGADMIIMSLDADTWKQVKEHANKPSENRTGI